MTSAAAAGQASFAMTNISKFSVGDFVHAHCASWSQTGPSETFRVLEVNTARSEIGVSANLVNTYPIAAVPQITLIDNLYSKIPIDVGFILNESGLSLNSLYVRKKQTAEVRVKGYAVMV